jgi:hypothetical protein
MDDVPSKLPQLFYFTISSPASEHYYLSHTHNLFCSLQSLPFLNSTRKSEQRTCSGNMICFVQGSLRKVTRNCSTDPNCKCCSSLRSNAALHKNIVNVRSCYRATFLKEPNLVLSEMMLKYNTFLTWWLMGAKCKYRYQHHCLDGPNWPQNLFWCQIGHFMSFTFTKNYQSNVLRRAIRWSKWSNIAENHSRHWKDHFLNDLKSDQDNLLKNDLDLKSRSKNFKKLEKKLIFLYMNLVKLCQHFK